MRSRPAFMTALTQGVLAHRRAVVLSWVVLTLAGMGAAATIGDALSRQFSAPGREGYEANQQVLRERGAGGDVPPIVLTATGAEPEAAARAFAQVARAVPRSRLVGVARDGRRLADGFASGDRRTAFALLFVGPAANGADENPVAVAAARRAAAGTDAGVRVTGVDALSDEAGSNGGLGLLAETALGGVGALAVLAFVFGSALAVVPIVVAAVSILTTFLILRGLATVTDVSFVVQFLVGLIGLGVAIDYSLLVVARWREEQEAGATGDAAVVRAMDSAGRAVAFSGVTVAIGLLALVVVPVPFIRSIGFGGMLIPLVSVAAALTLLPVILASIGPRLDRRRARRRQGQDRHEGWRRWATWVTEHRWIAAIAGLAVLIALAAPALGLRAGDPSVDALATGGQARDALRTLESSGVGAGALTPVTLVAADGDDGQALARDLGRRDDVQAVSVSRGRSGIGIVDVVPHADLSTRAGRDTLAAVRRRAGASDPAARVGGPSAQTQDTTHTIYRSFPVMVAVIALVTFLLLARAFRSVLLPLKAVALNVLSVGAAWGVMVLVWQHGHGSEAIWGIPSTGAITEWVPLAVFAFLYGLSMDYEVFILSRVREEYDRSGSTRTGVIEGLAATGRLVTSAALILFLTFVALAASPGTEIKILATGLAAGILIDATIVRALVVPALVMLFGRANWWTPRATGTR